MANVTSMLAHDTGREMSAHKKIWSTRKFSFKKWFYTCFIRVVLNIDECW